MGLTLSTRDLGRFRAATETLLSPLAYASTREWCDAVLRRVETLFQADRSLMFVPEKGELLVRSESLPPEMLSAFRDLPRGLGRGAVHTHRPDLDAVLRRRRRAGMEVWTNEMLTRAAGFDVKREPFYQEVVIPSGVAHGCGMTISLPVGEASLHVAHTRPSTDPFGEDGLELLGMLLPSFKAAVGMLRRLEEHRGALTRLLDELGHALLAVDPDGRILHRNRRLGRLLEEEPEAERVVSGMQELAASLGYMRAPESKTAPDGVGRFGLREIETGACRYRLHACYLAAGQFGMRETALVALERAVPGLPSVTSLMEDHGLTRREAEITRFLALGATNREIARRLSISPHTVRTHAERIFGKLGIHSRKGLALRLQAYQTWPALREMEVP